MRMLKHRGVLLVVLGALVNDGVQSFSAEPLKVALRSSKKEHVVGEPVFLAVTATYLGEKPIRAWKTHADLVAMDVELFTSEDGREFTEYRDGAHHWFNFEREHETLRAGDSCTRRVMLLHSARSPDRLALPRPGTYWVRARWPLIHADTVQRTEFESNVVEVRVRHPEGNDVEAWQALRAPELLFFIQAGYAQHDHPEVPGKALDLVRRMPDSSYHAGIRDALQRYFEDRTQSSTNSRIAANRELEEIRVFLGIPQKREPPPLFADDPRLDARITYGFPQPTPMDEVFKTLSTLSGVPLRLAPELRIRRMTCVEQTQSLRFFMTQEAGRDTRWVPTREGGYRLVSAGATGEAEGSDAAVKTPD